ncbi:MAG: hypothetical protein EBS05_18210 [Proteobacteria bacterium]|nr:hypothetical protein [Pseudomonadota bacterium]
MDSPQILSHASVFRDFAGGCKKLFSYFLRIMTIFIAIFIGWILAWLVGLMAGWVDIAFC